VTIGGDGLIINGRDVPVPGVRVVRSD